MFRFLLLACACLSLAGFSHSPAALISERLVAPGGVSPLLPAAEIERMLSRLPSRSGYAAGANGTPLFWRAMDPGDYRLRYRYLGITGNGDALPGFDLDFEAPTAAAPAPRGTVVLLHGWMMDGNSLLPWSLQLAQSGYRSISIDLRNHGRSGEGPAGYGLHEAADVHAVLHALQAQGEIEGPLYLMGVSYGAATAIFSAQDAGDLPLAGVVALESFENAGQAIRDMLPHMLTLEPQDWWQRWAMKWIRWRFDAQALESAVTMAGNKVGLDLDRVDVATALASADACVLLVHGSEDHHVPVAHGRALASASARAHYLELPGEDHLSLPMRLDILAPVVTDWLERNAGAPQTCPSPQALPA